MRTAVILVFVLVAASPSHASKSCMTLAEARAQFATSHLYWHGSDHCWDASAPRHRIVRHVKPREERQARDSEPEKPEKPEPKWRNAMSEMLPVDAPVVTPSIPQLAAIELPRMDWLERWVDVAQVVPPYFRRTTEAATADASPIAITKADPMVTPMRLILVFMGVVLILAVIELLFRNTIHERLD